MFWAKPAGNAKGVSIYRHWIFVGEALISSRAPLNAGSGNGQKLNSISMYIYIYTHTGWWFQTFFLFHFIHGMTSFPLTNSIIFQDGFLTTNQIYIGRWVISLRNSKGWWDDSHVIYLTAHSHDFNGEFKVICLVDFVCVPLQSSKCMFCVLSNLSL